MHLSPETFYPSDIQLRHQGRIALPFVCRRDYVPACIVTPSGGIRYQSLFVCRPDLGLEVLLCHEVFTDLLIFYWCTRHIIQRTPEQILELIADTVRNLCIKMNVPQDDAEECVKKVREQQMGYWFENMEKWIYRQNAGILQKPIKKLKLKSQKQKLRKHSAIQDA